MRIRISGLTLFTGNMSKNMWIVGTTPINVDSGKVSARCPKNGNQRYKGDHILIFRIFCVAFPIFLLWQWLIEYIVLCTSRMSYLLYLWCPKTISFWASERLPLAKPAVNRCYTLSSTSGMIRTLKKSFVILIRAST